jgi:hypothetical protein
VEQTDGLPVCKNVKALLRLQSALAIAPLLFVLAGCLSDPIDGPEIKPRVVTPPPKAWFFATNFAAPNSGDMVVRWNHSASDTQQNFKGYNVRLYQSDTSAFGDILGAFVAEATVLKVGNKVDTSVVFPNIPLRHYTAFVHGVKFADTLALSRDSIAASGFFDPRPLLNPTIIRAGSIGRHDVKLEWNVPATDTNSGLKGYQVYYLDADTGKFARTGPLVSRIPGRSTLETTISGLPELVRGADERHPQQEHAFRFWVKAVRADDIQFASDSATIVWAGAARVPIAEDSGGFRHILFFTQNDQGPTATDDSVEAFGQVQLSFFGNTVTLRATGEARLNTRIDTATSVDTITYAAPIVTGYDLTTLTLAPAAPGLGGIIVYVSMPNIKGTQYARIWIRQQPDGSFVTSRSGIFFQASYQTGATLSGTTYPYF